MGFLPSASKVSLAMKCQLPWHRSMAPWPKENKSQAAAKGDAVHAVAEKHAGGERPTHAYGSARTIDDVVRVAIDELTVDALYLEEQPIAYHAATDTARFLPKTGKARDYSAVRDGELSGTVDLIMARPGVVKIIDYKTGRHARKAAAQESWQLRLIAVAASRLFGADSVEVALIHLEDGNYVPDSFEFAPWDLDEYAGKLRWLVETIESQQVRGTMGAHCYNNFCPVRLKCPSIQGALALIADDAKKHLPVIGAVESNDQAKALRIAIKQGEEMLNAARRSLHDYAETYGVDMGDGITFGKVEVATESIDLDVPGALDKVLTIVGESAIKRKASVSKESIESAARAQQTKRGEGTKRAKQLYGELRAIGAMKEGRYFKFDDIRRKGGDVIDTDGVSVANVANDDGAALAASGE